MKGEEYRIKDFTLIVPLRERREYMKRLDNFYSSCSYRKVFVDSSKYPADDEIIKNLINFEYIHIGETPYPAKMLRVASDIVKTDFYFDLPDDDFISPRFIDIALPIIRKETSSSYIKGADISLPGMEKIDSQFLDFYEKIKDKDRSERVSCFLDSYWVPSQTQHTLIRTSDSIKIWHFVNSNPDLNYINYWEKIHSLFLHILGKGIHLKNIASLYRDFTIRKNQVINLDCIHEEFKYAETPNFNCSKIRRIYEYLGIEFSAKDESIFGNRFDQKCSLFQGERSVVRPDINDRLHLFDSDEIGKILKEIN